MSAKHIGGLLFAIGLALLLLSWYKNYMQAGASYYYSDGSFLVVIFFGFFGVLLMLIGLIVAVFI